ncbi:hypothetical protein O9992_26065 [Vibrio lentus]|nr:hypothetical protein [Vibrio lentus]
MAERLTSTDTKLNSRITPHPSSIRLTGSHLYVGFRPCDRRLKLAECYAMPSKSDGQYSVCPSFEGYIGDGSWRHLYADVNTEQHSILFY